MKRMIGASRREPHINHSYEKIAVLLYVCVCVYVCPNTSSTCSSHMHVRACAQIHTVEIVSVDRVLTLNVAHQTIEACFEAQAEEIETRKRRGMDQYTRVLSFCSNKTIYVPYHILSQAKRAYQPH